MRNFIAVVFDDNAKAYKALHALWQLDDADAITVHGTAVVHRDQWGRFAVDTKETSPVFATAVGVGIGALLGALAGPVGVAFGAAEGAVLGATAGAVIGGLVDMNRSDTRDQAEVETGFVLGRGKSAVIADISEDAMSAVDTRMKELGGKIFRRSKSSLENDAALEDGFFPYYDYLYPYEYVPSRYPAYYAW